MSFNLNNEKDSEILTLAINKQSISSSSNNKAKRRRRYSTLANEPSRVAFEVVDNRRNSCLPMPYMSHLEEKLPSNNTNSSKPKMKRSIMNALVTEFKVRDSVGSPKKKPSVSVPVSEDFDKFTKVKQYQLLNEENNMIKHCLKSYIRNPSLDFDDIDRNVGNNINSELRRDSGIFSNYLKSNRSQIMDFDESPEKSINQVPVIKLSLFNHLNFLNTNFSHENKAIKSNLQQSLNLETHKKFIKLKSMDSISHSRKEEKAEAIAKMQIKTKGLCRSPEPKMRLQSNFNTLHEDLIRIKNTNESKQHLSSIPSSKSSNIIVIEEMKRSDSSSNNNSEYSNSNRENKKYKENKIEINGVINTNSNHLWDNKNNNKNDSPFPDLVKNVIIDYPKKIENKFRELIHRKNVYDSVSEEEREDISASSYIIHPTSDFQIIWDFFIYISFIYSIIIIPISLGFLIERCEDRFLIILVLILDIMIDILYMCDIVISFFVGYYDLEENLIFNQNKIITNYTQGLFVFDIISGFPFNTLISSGLLSATPLRWLRLFRLIKLFKTVIKNNSKNHLVVFKKLFTHKGVRSYFYKKINISQKIINLFDYTIYFFITCHIFTGIWMYMALLSPGHNWTYRVNSDFTCDTVGLFYITSLYFTMVSFFTVGYGDIYPTSILEKSYSVILLVVSLIIYSFVVSYLSNFSLNKTTRKKELEKNIEFLQELSYNDGIPYKIYKNTLDFLKYSFQSNKTDNNKFLFDLPTILRNEVICAMYKDIIHNFKFFNFHFAQDSIVKIILALRPVGAYKNEVLIQEKAFVEEIIFVGQGRLILSIVYKEINIKLIDIGKYEHFGEYLMFRGKRSPVTLTVKSDYCELFLLRKIDLIKLNDFKDLYGRIINKSKFIMKKLHLKIKKNKFIIRQDLKKSAFDENNLNNLNNNEHFKKYSTEKNRISSNLKISKVDLNCVLSKTINNKSSNSLIDLRKDMNLNSKDSKDSPIRTKLETNLNQSILKMSMSLKSSLENGTQLPFLLGLPSKKQSSKLKEIKVSPGPEEKENRPESKENIDEKQNISYNLNYFNNYNITNQGNLFINFNVGSESAPMLSKVDGKNNKNDLSQSQGNILNFSSQDFPNIIINNNQGASVTAIGESNNMIKYPNGKPIDKDKNQNIKSKMSLEEKLPEVIGSINKEEGLGFNNISQLKSSSNKSMKSLDSVYSSVKLTPSSGNTNKQNNKVEGDLIFSKEIQFNLKMISEKLDKIFEDLVVNNNTNMSNNQNIIIEDFDDISTVYKKSSKFSLIK